MCLKPEIPILEKKTRFTILHTILMIFDITRTTHSSLTIIISVVISRQFNAVVKSGKLARFAFFADSHDLLNLALYVGD